MIQDATAHMTTDHPTVVVAAAAATATEAMVAQEVSLVATANRYDQEMVGMATETVEEATATEVTAAGAGTTIMAAGSDITKATDMMTLAANEGTSLSTTALVCSVGSFAFATFISFALG